MTDSMMALVYKGRGELRLEKRPVPVLQDDRDAVVLVTLSTICTSDLHILRGAVPRARPDTVLGHEFVGEVVRVGPGVRNLRPGESGGSQLHLLLRRLLVLPSRLYQQL